MPSNDDGEEKPFLTNEEGDFNYNETPENKRCSLRFRIVKTHGVLFCLHIAFLSLNVIFLVWNVTPARHGKDSDVNADALKMAYSPAQTAVQYTVKDLNWGRVASPYTGEPRPEVDQAWSRLLKSTMVKISKEELNRMNRTSIALRDGSGYIGYLESNHMLHCVKRLYQAQHPEYYTKFKGTHEFTPDHWDHCFEVLRQGIMCNADLTVNTYYWKGPDAIQGNRTGSRRCTDWHRLQEWAEKRPVKFEGADNFYDTLVRDNTAGSTDQVGLEQLS
ncbi:hypothetical protein EV356DRAFT_367735 [Viridothelium virens]|uniref:Tat pathway signal sequence n=1 Tax=Viridothelium virens TaxID=1048519 RepID=A0A6A6GVY5_VIRVR|nr:hypothetical protein EV356DRAFT_367735 [Viridothelium virens]